MRITPLHYKELYFPFNFVLDRLNSSDAVFNAAHNGIRRRGIDIQVSSGRSRGELGTGDHGPAFA